MNDDLISRKALAETAKNMSSNLLNEWDTLGVLELIYRQPSVDPHKHGRRREVGITMEYHHYTCSACKHNVKSPGRFCPNCGARMDGGEEQ